jgi:hypothetical protein
MFNFRSESQNPESRIESRIAKIESYSGEIKLLRETSSSWNPVAQVIKGYLKLSAAIELYKLNSSTNIDKAFRKRSFSKPSMANTKFSSTTYGKTFQVRVETASAEIFSNESADDLKNCRIGSKVMEVSASLENIKNNEGALSRLTVVHQRLKGIEVKIDRKKASAKDILLDVAGVFHNYKIVDDQHHDFLDKADNLLETYALKKKLKKLLVSCSLGDLKVLRNLEGTDKIDSHSFNALLDVAINLKEMKESLEQGDNENVLRCASNFDFQRKALKINPSEEHSMFTECGESLIKGYNVEKMVEDSTVAIWSSSKTPDLTPAGIAKHIECHKQLNEGLGAYALLTDSSSLKKKTASLEKRYFEAYFTKFEESLSGITLEKELTDSQFSQLMHVMTILQTPNKVPVLDGEGVAVTMEFPEEFKGRDRIEQCMTKFFTKLENDHPEKKKAGEQLLEKIFEYRLNNSDEAIGTMEALRGISDKTGDTESRHEEYEEYASGIQENGSFHYENFGITVDEMFHLTSAEEVYIGLESILLDVQQRQDNIPTQEDLKNIGDLCKQMESIKNEIDKFAVGGGVLSPVVDHTRKTVRGLEEGFKQLQQTVKNFKEKRTEEQDKSEIRKDANHEAIEVKSGKLKGRVSIDLEALEGHRTALRKDGKMNVHVHLREVEKVVNFIKVQLDKVVSSQEESDEVQIDILPPKKESLDSFLVSLQADLEEREIELTDYNSRIAQEQESLDLIEKDIGELGEVKTKRLGGEITGLQMEMEQVWGEGERAGLLGTNDLNVVALGDKFNNYKKIIGMLKESRSFQKVLKNRKSFVGGRMLEEENQQRAGLVKALDTSFVGVLKAIRVVDQNEIKASILDAFDRSVEISTKEFTSTNLGDIFKGYTDFLEKDLSKCQDVMERVKKDQPIEDRDLKDLGKILNKLTKNTDGSHLGISLRDYITNVALPLAQKTQLHQELSFEYGERVQELKGLISPSRETKKELNGLRSAAASLGKNIERLTKKKSELANNIEKKKRNLGSLREIANYNLGNIQNLYQGIAEDRKAFKLQKTTQKQALGIMGAETTEVDRLEGIMNNIAIHLGDISQTKEA